MKLTIVALTLLFCTIASYGHVTPSGGSREKPLRQGERVTITWDSTRVASPVTISLWDGERRRTIRIHSAYATSQSSFDWTIPDTVQPGSLYRFIVASSSTPTIAHFSESFVAIHPVEQRITTVFNSTSEQQLRIMPVPARDVIRVQWSGSDAKTVVLSTVLGATITSWPCASGSTQLDLNVSAIPSGVYQLTLQCMSGDTTTRTVVIQH